MVNGERFEKENNCMKGLLKGLWQFSRLASSNERQSRALWLFVLATA